MAFSVMSKHLKPIISNENHAAAHKFGMWIPTKWSVFHTVQEKSPAQISCLYTKF